MIIGFLLQVFYVVIVAVFYVLPGLPLPVSFASAFATLWGYLSAFSFLFPMPVLLTVLVAALVFHVAILALDFTLWIIHLIRGR